jgi:hypothetical protein
MPAAAAEKPEKRNWAPLCASVFVLCCLLSAVRLINHARHATDPNQVLRRSDQRFAGLKSALPSSGVIGYVGDSGAPPGQYYLAQYALAPLVVDYSPDHVWVVGNFPKARPEPAALAHLELIKDFGDGVELFRNKDAR